MSRHTPLMLFGGDEERRQGRVVGHGEMVYHRALFPSRSDAMQELNPLYHQITDLQGRVDALRGYL